MLCENFDLLDCLPVSHRFQAHCQMRKVERLFAGEAEGFGILARLKLERPNCPGVMTPGQAKIGFIPNHVGRPGRVGVAARSGTLTYEVIQGLSESGYGETTAVGIGGDPVLGSTFVDILALFADDPLTEAVALVGEIGGSDEERAADWIRSSGFD